MTLDLFANLQEDGREALGSQAFVLRGFALAQAPLLCSAVDVVQQLSPFRHLVTPGGLRMSIAMTNCGDLGWISDRRGYRYTGADPDSGKPWPRMPEVFTTLARDAAAVAGFENFVPDACLINRYLPDTRLSLHQDKNERDLSFPVVSVSLGMTATFLFGGNERSDKTIKVPLYHGDVVVWGGEDRLRYHGVMPLKDNPHPALGNQRINMTFRNAG